MDIIITEETRKRVTTLSRQVRIERILFGMDMSTPGIEISPLYNPISDKSKHNVVYTDYTSAEESRVKHADYEHPDIVDLDFIWHQNTPLAECIPGKNKFEWAIACHVLEHVPDPIGWMNEILECLNTGGILSLVMPNSDLTNDRLRKKTEVSDLVESWLVGRRIPGPSQIYDFVRNNISLGQTAIASEDGRHYTKQQAIEFTMHSWNTGEYLDVHCSVFNPLTFRSLITEIASLGIMNVEIKEVCPAGEEFYVKLQKKGEPVLPHPQRRIQQQGALPPYQKDLEHARKAFADAVEIQESLKAEIASLKKSRRSFWKRLFG